MKVLGENFTRLFFLFILFFKSDSLVLWRHSKTIHNNGYNEYKCRINFNDIVSAANKTLSKVFPKIFKEE